MVKMKSLKGTKTEKNVLMAFAGESQARNRYSYFASQAKKEGYEQMAAIFLDTADNEKEHAKVFFKLLEGGMVDIAGAFPAGVIGDTKANLLAAADGEMFENTTLYPGFSGTAEAEGFPEIARTFNRITKYVATREGAELAWQGSVALRDGVAEVTELKQQDGPALADGQRVLVICDRNTLIGCKIFFLIAPPI